MYSKCIVAPLMSTPIAITASKGRLCVPKPDPMPPPVTGVAERGVPMFSPPSRSVAVATAWIWDPAIKLINDEGMAWERETACIPLTGQGKLKTSWD
jgi:hypothetical protein